MSAEGAMSIGLIISIIFSLIPIIMFIVAAVIIVKFVSKTKGNSQNAEKTEAKEGSFKPQSFATNGSQPNKTQRPSKPKATAAQIAQFEEQLKQLCKNSVALNISGETEYIKGGTRFGGKPDVPSDFMWPYFKTDTFDDKEVKPRPLAFLAQFDLSEISAFDTEDLLPRSGTLAFFYELGSQRWGYDAEDGGCAKVFWFHEWEDLSPADFPEDLPEEFRLPMLNISATPESSYPDSEDFYLHRTDWRDTSDAFDTALSNLCADKGDNISKLLGWANVIQGNMTSDCERVFRGYTSDEVWNSNNFPKDELEKIETAADNWTLLFQLDTVSNGNFELMFGDCGRIYFYIRKDDLRAKRFDRVWLILQCG